MGALIGVADAPETVYLARDLTYAGGAKHAADASSRAAILLPLVASGRLT
ncbi:hypothetical protein [Pimelobacter sp. 30-1]|nr:hypothetical protein [Pimelobacter sp. 30-1]